MRRLRPLTKLKGKPAVLVAAHPIKNAPEDNLLPYGSGAVLNEVDGNLTLWKNSGTGIVSLHWQGKLRGLDFEPLNFRLDSISSPDLLDAKGRQFLLPVLRPCDAASAQQREAAETNLDIELLRTMIAEPDGSQEDWGRAIGRSKSSVNARLQKLKASKLCRRRPRQVAGHPKGHERDFRMPTLKPTLNPCRSGHPNSSVSAVRPNKHPNG
jgi:hypothetical protein